MKKVIKGLVVEYEIDDSDSSEIEIHITQPIRGSLSVFYGGGEYLTTDWYSAKGETRDPGQVFRDMSAADLAEAILDGL